MHVPQSVLPVHMSVVVWEIGIVRFCSVPSSLECVSHHILGTELLYHLRLPYFSQIIMRLRYLLARIICLLWRLLINASLRKGPSTLTP